jgi:hypothetical protein
MSNGRSARRRQARTEHRPPTADPYDPLTWGSFPPLSEPLPAEPIAYTPPPLYVWPGCEHPWHAASIGGIYDALLNPNHRNDDSAEDLDTMQHGIPVPLLCGCVVAFHPYNRDLAAIYDDRWWSDHPDRPERPNL